MNISEVIENHGPIVAAAATVEILVCFDIENQVFSVIESNKDGTYSLKEQYDPDSKYGAITDDTQDEAEDILDSILGDDNEEGE